MPSTIIHIAYNTYTIKSGQYMQSFLGRKKNKNLNNSLIIYIRKSEHFPSIKWEDTCISICNLGVSP